MPVSVEPSTRRDFQKGLYSGTLLLIDAVRWSHSDEGEMLSGRGDGA